MTFVVLTGPVTTLLSIRPQCTMHDGPRLALWPSFRSSPFIILFPLLYWPPARLLPSSVAPPPPRGARASLLSRPQNPVSQWQVPAIIQRANHSALAAFAAAWQFRGGCRGTKRRRGEGCRDGVPWAAQVRHLRQGGEEDVSFSCCAVLFVSYVPATRIDWKPQCVSFHI